MCVFMSYLKYYTYVFFVTSCRYAFSAACTSHKISLRKRKILICEILYNNFFFISHVALPEIPHTYTHHIHTRR